MINKNLLRVLGPGLLYAGAAVGVSHLVQSTKAGAGYGFDLLWILVLANAIKYPFFEFGPRYATVTGNSLIEGYSKIGKWALVLFALVTVFTMFSIQAAVTIVTAGLAGNIFGIGLNPVYLSAILLVITMLVLMIGRYNILDKLIKLVIVLLTVSTLIAVFSAMGKGYHPDPEFARNFSWNNRLDIFFLITFIGWMPAPLDVTIWQSLWTLEKNNSLSFKPKLREVLIDFKIGYIGTAFLAVCFLTLGAYVMYGSNEELSPLGVVFADQLIRMYTSNIGHWSYYFIAIAALSTMFSTTITCLDAYPRVMKPLTEAFFPSVKKRKFHSDLFSWFWIIVIIIGSVLLLSIFSGTMGVMVDIATTLSFVTASLLAILNYIVVTDKHVPKGGRPGKWLRIYAWVGIVFLCGFTLFYLYWRFM